MQDLGWVWRSIQQIPFLPAQLLDPASAEAPGVFGCEFLVLSEGWSRKSVPVLGQVSWPALPALLCVPSLGCTCPHSQATEWDLPSPSCHSCSDLSIMPARKDFPRSCTLCLIPKSTIETLEGFKPTLESEAQEQRTAWSAVPQSPWKSWKIWML